MPQNSPASSDKPEDSKKPAVTAANPLLDSIMSKPAVKHETKAKTPSLLDTIGAFTSGAVETGISTAAIVLRHDSNKGGTLTNVAANLFDVAKDPIRTATGIKDQTVKAYNTVKSGDVLGIAHLSGGLAFTLGTAGLGGANTVGKVGARTEAIVTAESALTRTAAARTLVNDVSSILKSSSRESIDDVVAAGTRRTESLVPKVVEKPSLLTPGQPISETLRSMFGTKTESLAGRMDFGSRAFAGVEPKIHPVAKPLSTVEGAVKPAIRPVETAIKPEVLKAELPKFKPEPVVKPDLVLKSEPVIGLKVEPGKGPHLPEHVGEPVKLRTAVEPAGQIEVGRKVELPQSVREPVKAAHVEGHTQPLDMKTVTEGVISHGEKLAAELIEGESTALRRNSTKLSKTVDESVPAAPGTPGEKFVAAVKKLDEILQSPKVVAHDVELAIKHIEGPEFKQILAENPKAVELLNDMKTSSSKLTEAGFSGRIAEVRPVSPFPMQEITAPLSENFAAKVPGKVAAEQGIAAVENVSAKIAESGVKVSQEVSSALQTVERNLKAIAEKGATPQVVEDLSRAMRSVEQNLSRDLLDSPVGKNVMETRQAVNSVLTSEVERGSIAQIENSLKAMDQSAVVLRRQTADFADAIAESASGRNGAVVDKLNAAVRKIDDVLEARAETPMAAATKAREIQQLVKQFERPEYQDFLVNNPKAARLVEEIKVSSTNIGNSAIKVESSAVALERIETVAKFGEQTTTVATKVEKLAATANPELQLPNVAEQVKQISSELKAIKSGANPDVAMASVRNRIEAIEASGARDLAQELKTTVAELERGSVAVSRVQKMEAAVGTIERETGKIGNQVERLTAAADNQVKGVSENLDFISRQSKNLTNAVDDVQSVTRIKESLARIEELGGQTLFTGERAVAYRELKQSVANLDRAAVEAQGLRSFEASSQGIVKEADRIASVSTRAQAITTDVAVGERLGNVERAASEVKAAATLEQQTSALKKLSNEIEDPRLQSTLNKSIEGRQVLEELKTSVNNLKQNLEMRGLETATVKLEAQAPNAVRAAQSLEQSVARDAELAGNQPLKQAVADYTRAAESLSVRSERSVALKQMDEQLAVIEREVKPGSSVLNDVNVLKQNHQLISDAAVDAVRLAQSIIEKRLPPVENLFNQVAVSSSSTVQRELIKQTAAEIQTLRYLSSETSIGIAPKLEQAQAKLVHAANELEVAAYSSKLIKLAANGDAGAAGKLLFAGLTSDGFRTTFKDFFAVRSHMIPLIGGGGDAGRMMRSLSASDDIFALNRAAIFNPSVVRAMSGATMGLGVGTMYVSDRMIDARDQKNSVEVQRNFAPDAVETSQNEVKAVSAQAVGSRPDNTFTPNGQAVVRNAYAAEIRNKAVIAPVSSELSPLIRSAALNQISAKPEIGAFGLNTSDPDYEQKKFLIGAYGTEHFRGKGSETTPAEASAMAFMASQGFLVKPSSVVRSDNRFEKPATDRFPLATALSLTSPVSLMNASTTNRTSTRTAGSGSIASGRTSDTKMMFSALAASANEGGSGRGKVGEGEERTEADVLEQGSTGTTNNHANNNDEDDDGDNTQVVAQPNNIPSVQSPATAVDPKPVTIVAGPPRKRQTKVNQAV